MLKLFYNFENWDSQKSTLHASRSTNSLTRCGGFQSFTEDPTISEYSTPWIKLAANSNGWSEGEKGKKLQTIPVDKNNDYGKIV